MEGTSFVVIGAGAIGGFVGSLLHHAGFRVRFLLRDSPRSLAQQQVLSEKGLAVLCSSDPGFRRTIPAADIPNIFTTDAAACLATCSCVLVATKRGQNRAVHEQLAQYGVKCPVVFLQNGLRICEELGPQSYEAIEAVVSFNTVYDMQASAITLAEPLGEAALVLDGHRASARGLAAQLAATGLRATVMDDFYAAQCGKLILNMTNAVNALSGEYIAPMLMQASYRHTLAASIREAEAVFRAAGVEPKAAMPKDSVMLRWFATLLCAPQPIFVALVGRKLKGRGQGHTSMAQDLMARRVPTEIDFLNGEITRLGAKLSVATPVNEHLVALIKEAEAANNGPPGLSGTALAAAVGVPLGAGSGRPALIAAALLLLAVGGAAVAPRRARL